MTDADLLRNLDALQRARTDDEWLRVERALADEPPSVERDTLARAAPVEAIRPLVSEGGAKADRPAPFNWRSQFWSVPGETRLSVRDLAEAVGKSPSWVWKRLAAGRHGPPIPHTKVDGAVVFRADEVRAWMRARDTLGGGARLSLAAGGAGKVRSRSPRLAPVP